MVRRWLAGYEAAWRAAGTERLAGLFTADATYLQSPYEQPITGLPAIARMWQEEREGPGEVFTVATASSLSTAPPRWSGLRSATETRPARSTAICGSSGSAMTGAAPGSRSGPTGLSALTLPPATRHNRSPPG